MTHRQISLVLRTNFISTARFHCLFGAGLAVVIACSSNDSATGSAQPTEQASAPDGSRPSAPADMANAGTPSVESGMPAGVSSEQQDVGELAPPQVDMGPAGTGSMTSPAGEQPVGDASIAPIAGAAVPSAGCGRARALQDGPQTLVSGGITRSYFLETPDTYDNAHPHRVVFMFHWNYGSIDAIVNPPDADRNTDRPFYGISDIDDDRTIFVVPQGLANPGGGAGWANPDNRDVIFTDDMLSAISADLCIDTTRVFTTGFSYGAGMSVALACVRPDKFRAAAVYAPAFISGVAPAQCATPIPFFQSHGVDDPVINYQTGTSVLGTFTTLNGCAAMTPPEPPADGHGCVSYEGCVVPTRFCNFGAGEGNPFNTSLRGHYPTSKDPGQNTSWVPAEAWSFISQF